MNNMKDIFLKLREALTGQWEGEGIAQYPTIDKTAYTEKVIFVPDQHKDAVFFEQKTLYKNDTEKNGQTAFWDTGFILLRGDKILLVSSQIGGRQETYEYMETEAEGFTFNSISIANDLKQTIMSQRVFIPAVNELNYMLSMASNGNTFQNHLAARLRRSTDISFS
jgi:hypothetical protein